MIFYPLFSFFIPIKFSKKTDFYHNYPQVKNGLSKTFTQVIKTNKVFVLIL